MKIIDDTSFVNICNQSNICIADPKHNIGRELSYCDVPLRTIILHIVESDTIDYITKLFKSMLSIEDSWIVSPRFVYHGGFNIGDTTYAKEILDIDSKHLDELVEQLLSYRDKLLSVNDDLYIVGSSGNVIINYEHHMDDEGITIFLNDIKKTERLLIDLNNLGAELDLYSKH